MTRRVPAPLLVAAVVSVQLGGALAATLVRLVGVFGSVTLQLTIAAAVMLVTVRPRLRGLNDRGLAGPRRSAHQSHPTIVQACTAA